MKKLLLIITTTLLSFGLAITAYSQLKNGEVVKIKNVNAGKYAAPKDLTGKGNGSIHLYSNSNDAWLNWKVVTAKSGYFKFQNVHTNLFLGITNGSKEQNGVLCQKIGNSDDQLWKLEKTSTGFKLKNKNSNLYAAVEGGSTNNFAKLIQWGDIAQPDIIWQLETLSSGNSKAEGKKVLFDVILNYLAVSEATRNRIDNGDCKRIFGQVGVELWELDEDNEMKTKLRSYNNMPEMVYNQTNYKNPPTAALSYYQDNLSASGNNQMGKVTYNIPESLLTEKKLMLIIKTNLATRHKDNDFASYDALKMDSELQTTYILDNHTTRTETIETITDNGSTNQAMILMNFIIPYDLFQRADDTHKIWVKFSTKIN